MSRPQIAPYVSKEKKRRRRIWRWVIGVIALFILYFIFLGIAWFFMRAPFFRVGSVVVTGDSGMSSGDVIALAEADPGRHIGFFSAMLGWGNMLAWPDAIPTSTLAMAPQIAGITVTKDYFAHTVTLAVTERQPFGIWCFVPGGPGADGAGEQCYWFDAQGIMFERALATQGNIIFMVNDYSQKDRGLGSAVLPPEFDQNFISIMNVLKATGLGVKEIDLNDLSLEEVDVRTAVGPTLEFSLRFPADEYLPVLQSLIAQPGFAKLQYVDCRTEDRVFYK